MEQNPERHKIAHNYREEVIVPYAAVTDNVKIKAGNSILFADGVETVIEKVYHLNMLSDDAEKEVTRLYRVSPWGLLKIWFSKNVPMNTLVFLHLHVKKVTT